jgi:hypothetical protein
MNARWLTLLAGLALSAACTDAVLPDPVILEIASGDGQQARLGVAVSHPLVVRVTDLEGAPMEGVGVEWRVIEGRGSVGSRVVETDSRGLASTRLTLDPDQWENAADARAHGERVVFEALGEPDELLDVADLVVDIELSGGRLTVDVMVENHWAGTVYVVANVECHVGGYLRAPSGDLIEWLISDSCTGSSVAILAGQQVSLGTLSAPSDALEPGEYVVDLRFSTRLHIGVRSATFPSMLLPVEIE